MNTLTASEIPSIGIRQYLGPDARLEMLGSIGEADERLTLYRFLADGTEVIDTNAEPIWESDLGFAETRKMICTP